ncbi:MAG: FAD-binding oxidoreductase [Pseudomonadota bacterium]|jgi:glycine/D-amino acid oxidase-like deaminating enzyme|nr:FAD-binding oxidoreductase [Pseudomonadota bacterium]
MTALSQAEPGAELPAGLAPLSRVDSDATLPSSADAVIIGAGIIGISTALFLAQKGLSVVVLEKGLVSAEQSGRNWGWCRTQNRHPAEVPMMLRSLELWDGIADLTGEDVGFRRCGAMHLTDSDAELGRFRAWMADTADMPTGATLLDAAGVADRLPGVRSCKGAMFTAGDGRAEPDLVVPALARACRRLGVKLFQNCAAQRLDVDGSSIRSVVSEAGTIASKRVLIATGVWSSQFARPLSLRLPQLRLHSTVCRIETSSPLPDISIMAPGFSLRRRLDGGATLTIGLTAIADVVPDSFRFLHDFLPVLRDRAAYGVRVRFGARFLSELTASRKDRFRTERIYRVPPRKGDISAACANAQRALGLSDMTVTRLWGGEFDVTPDALPIIDSVPEIEGLFLSTGYSGHGFGLGPGAGLATAAMVAGEAAPFDRHAFRLDRFRTGR